ncbi:MAG: NAD-binding protein [bacterium]
MLKEISLLSSHYVICGFGRVGEAVAEKLQACGARFVFIEANVDSCQQLKDNNYLYVEGDAINDAVLMSAGIKNANGLLAILPSVPDNLFITLTARELNPTLHIIARADNAASEKRLLQGGADSVISPYTSAGHQIAANMLAVAGNLATAQESIHIMKVVPQWIDVLEGSRMIGQTIGNISKEMKRKVFGLRRGDRDYLDPNYSWKIEAQDKLLVIEERVDNATEQATQKPKPQTVVIVDDNPVILKLYTRLLHRAGFVPLTAKNGSEALKLILEEKPDAAVIDFMLPILSGIEICEKVRAERTCDDVKLILFTSDEEAETRQRALNAGANAVVVKSPQASELIETVIYLLQRDLKCASSKGDVSRLQHARGAEAKNTSEGSDPVEELCGYRSEERKSHVSLSETV